MNPYSIPPLPPSWQPVLEPELSEPYFQKLREFLLEDSAQHEIYPAPENLFAALRQTPFEDVKVLLLGQDPYPGAGHAHGLCFSVSPATKCPPSLKNMLKELSDDQRCPPPKENFCLEPWSRQGVLLLNTILTVRAGQPLSHRGKGWEMFTDQIITALNNRPKPFVAALWGGQAQQKARLIDATRHKILTAPHPSPLSAHQGFFGSRPFSAINVALGELGDPPIDWCLG